MQNLNDKPSRSGVRRREDSREFTRRATPKFRIAVLLTIAAAGLLLAACAAAGPRISLGVETLDLGDVTNGEIVEMDVTVLNHGTAPLEIEAVSTSCGCTRAVLEPMSIPAGGTGVLRITFDSGAHGPQEKGELLRQIFIASNDLREPEMVLELRANVLPPPVP